MPKTTELLKILAAKTGNQKLAQLADVETPEIQDEDFTAFSDQINSLLTVESAANNADVIAAVTPKIKGGIDDEYKAQVKKSIYTQAEEKLKPLGEKFGVDLSDMRIDEIVDKLQGVNPSKAKTQAYEDLQKEFKKTKSEFEEQIKKQQSEFENYKIDSFLTQKMNGVKLADAYQEPTLKKALFGEAKSKIKGKAIIKLDDKSESGYKLLDPNNPEIELFGQDNNKLKVEDVFDSFFEPYKKKKPTNDPNPNNPPVKIDKKDQGLNDRSAAGLMRSHRVQY